MPTRLLERLKTIVSAEVSAFLEAQEDTTQRITEDERILSGLRARLGDQLAAQYRLSKQVRDDTRALEVLDEKAAFAVEQGREDLARAALTQKFCLKAAQSKAASELDALASEINTLDGLIKALSDTSPQEDQIEAQLAELEQLQAKTANQKD